MKLVILVVDDDPLMLQILTPHLADFGTKLAIEAVATAQTPEHALEQVDSIRPGPLVVLSDFNLKAAMNGVQLLEEISQRRPASARILFSGYAREQIGDLGPPGIVQGLLDKPLRIRDMLAPFAQLINDNLQTKQSTQ